MKNGLLGTPDTSLRGLKTRTARRVLKSKLELSTDINIVKNPVTTTVKSIIFQMLRIYECLCKAKPKATIFKDDSIQNMQRKYFSVDS